MRVAKEPGCTNKLAGPGPARLKVNWSAVGRGRQGGSTVRHDPTPHPPQAQSRIPAGGVAQARPPRRGMLSAARACSTSKCRPRHQCSMSGMESHAPRQPALMRVLSHSSRHVFLPEPTASLNFRGLAMQHVLRLSGSIYSRCYRQTAARPGTTDQKQTTRTSQRRGGGAFGGPSSVVQATGRSCGPRLTKANPGQ